MEKQTNKQTKTKKTPTKPPSPKNQPVIINERTLEVLGSIQKEKRKELDAGAVFPAEPGGRWLLWLKGLAIQAPEVTRIS